MTATLRRTHERHIIRVGCEISDLRAQIRSGVDDKEVDHLAALRKFDAALDDLDVAVRALRKAGIDPLLESAPAIDSNPRDTSIGAKFAAAPKRGSLRRKIVLALGSVNPAQGGMTCDEMEMHLRGAHTSVSSAMNSLMIGGWIEDSGRRRKTRSGTEAIVWRLTQPATQQLVALVTAEQENP